MMILRMQAPTLLLTFLLAVACTGPQGIQEGFIENGEHPLYYKTMGSGEPVVVLHGGPGFDHRQFLPFIWELARDHQVILYDQRSTGLSGGPVDPESINIDAFIADIEAVRRHFGIEKMNLLGHSWGGILAMHYSLKNEDKLKSLILCSTSATAESFPEMRATYEQNREPGDAERLEEIYGSDGYKNGDPEAYTTFWRIFFKPYFKDQSMVEQMDLQFTENTIRNGNAVAGYIMESIGEFDLHEELKRLQVPTLILHGDADPMHARYAERIHKSIGGPKLVIVAGAGHWLFIDGTETFTKSILEFLADPRPLPCSEPWYQHVETVLSSGDGMGHGPDIGSDEWKSVIEFKLGVRGNAEVPNRRSAAWCDYIDALLVNNK